jgi:hypothetical protein
MLVPARSPLIHHDGCRASMDAATYRCVPENRSGFGNYDLRKAYFQKSTHDDFTSDIVDGPRGIRRVAPVAHHGRDTAARS